MNAGLARLLAGPVHYGGHETALGDGLRAIRLLQNLALICLEATLAHLVVNLLTGASATSLRWWVLVLIAAGAAFVSSAGRAVPGRNATISVIAAVAAIWLGTAAQTSGTEMVAPWQVPGRLLNLDHPGFFQTYLALGTSLYMWWRGSMIGDVGHAELVSFFRRSVIMLAAIIGGLALIGYDPGFSPGSDEAGARLIVELLGFVVLGLAGLSLTRIVETSGQSTPGSAWRWLRSGVLSAVALVVVGLLPVVLLVDPAGVVLRELLGWLVFGLVTLMSPLIALVLVLVELIRSVLPESPLAMELQATATAVAEDQVPATAQIQVPEALLMLPVILALVLPIVVLVLLIVFARRRDRRMETPGDEQRTSIFTWGAVRAELADLLRGLRRPGGSGGLRDRLRMLSGHDPVTRVRRRYVQLLLAGEAAGATRQPAATPHEFEPALAGIVDPDAAVAALTETYERARYAPDSIDENAASRADAAWQALSDRRSPDAT
jgi:hypothetical protein